MVTKEQCLFERLMDEVSYGRDQKIIQAVVNVYNQGKKYASDMLFVNDENGLDQGLEGYSPSFIVYSILGEDSEYDMRDPFFVIENGVKSIDSYDLQRMLTPEDVQKLSTNDVFEYLDDSEISEAFDEYVRQNYPQQYKTLDTDNLYYMGYRTSGHILDANWDELVKELMNYKPEMDESRVLELTEEELREMVSEGTKQAIKKLKEGKSGIHIDPENKGKFTATKERTGKSTEELTHSKNPLTRKRAIFAQNAKKWNHKK